MQETPSFDHWSSMFLLAVGMGLFLFLSLVFSKNKKNRPIAFLVLAYSIILLQYVLYWTKYTHSFPYLTLLPQVCYFMAGPLLYLYFLNLYTRKVTFKFAFHFLPAFLMFLFYFPFLLNTFNITQINIPWHWFRWNSWLVTVHLAFYAIVSYRLFTKKKVNSNFEKLRDRWSKILWFLFIAFGVSFLSYFILVRFPFFDTQWDYMISLSMSISIYTIGFFVIKQPRVFDGEFFSQFFLPSETSEDTSIEESTMIDELYSKLTHYMKTEKPFIDNELRLVNLADALGFSTHLLSKVINKKSGKNFNQFVNDYRLNEAKRLLIDNPDYSIKSIYFDVGFNNKATFYNAFKKEFRCTPSEFRDSMISS